MSAALRRHLTSVATACGAEKVEWLHGGKHLQMALTVEGRTRRVFMSATPSDKWAIKHICHDIKKALLVLKDPLNGALDG